jgi:hypothetical protein
MTVENRIIEIVKYFLEDNNEVTLNTNIKNVASLYHYHRIMSAVNDEYDIDVPNLLTIRQIIDFIYLYAK